MKTYETINGLVNGNVISDLLSICNDWFINPWYQRLHQQRAECLFCGCLQNERGGGDHSAADCPVIHLQNVADKYPALITIK